MTDKEKMAREKLFRLQDALADDLQNLSDDEILAEAKENGENVEEIATHTSSLISDVIRKNGQHRLAAARAAYDANTPADGANVLKFSLSKKREIVNAFAKNDNGFEEKLTLAARNGKDTEADIDSLLEDLIDLGEIDDEGNPS